MNEMMNRTAVLNNRFFFQPKNKDPYTRHTLFNTNAADVENAVVQNGGSGGREVNTLLLDLCFEVHISL